MFLAAILMASILTFGHGANNNQAYAAAKNDKLVIVAQVIPRDRVATEAVELEKYLEKRTGKDVEIFFPTSNAAIVESMRSGHAQVALGVGTLVAALAAKHVKVEDPMLVEYRNIFIGNESRVESFYYTYWIAHKDSWYASAKSLEDLRGSRACFPSETSVSGFVMPMKTLVEKGYAKPLKSSQKIKDLPLQFFKDVTFGGGYAQCWEALKQNRVDVTVMAGDVPEKVYKEALENSNILETSGPAPAHVVLMSKSLPKDVKQKLTSALMDLNKDPEMMKKFVSGIFVKFDKKQRKEHLAPVAEALSSTGLDRVIKL
ncbi:PhnD/SsuA/transferrin family substrate-binding protein [Nitrososphaera sp.]|uniref:PhnD/SsuA/transferrin family substrate-binding protein n=1 Tax=Nitrososphaera sp. TaxID=1971748 RepID=UPI00307D25D5